MSLTGMSADLSKCHKAPVNRAPVSAADVALLACVYVLLSKFILATVQINIHSFIHHPCRQQSRGWGFHHCLSVFQTISQKRMQVKSPNSTHKCSTISYGRPFILGSKVTTSDWMQHCRCCSVCKWHWVFFCITSPRPIATGFSPAYVFALCEDWILPVLWKIFSCIWPLVASLEAFCDIRPTKMQFW